VPQALVLGDEQDEKVKRRGVHRVADHTRPRGKLRLAPRLESLSASRALYAFGCPMNA
jgi:hypothetical protein